MMERKNNNISYPLRYPSLFDRNKWVNVNTWILTQAYIGRSTGYQSCCFEAGHSVLFIEAILENQQRIFRFDYQEKPPKELKSILHDYITAKGKAWLHQIDDGDLLQIKGRQIINNSKYHFESWEVKTSGAEKLLNKLQNEFKQQIIHQLPAKDYSFFWENCHFLIAEKLSDQEFKDELSIDTANSQYIDKFHMGGWKYAIALNFKNSIIFATLVSPLQIGFINYVLKTADFNIGISVIDEYDKKFPFIIAKYDSTFPLMINFFNHSFYLIRLVAMNGLGRLHKKGLVDFTFNFILTTSYMVISLGLHALLSPFSKGYYLNLEFQDIGIDKIDYTTTALSVGADITIPFIALTGSLAFNSAIFYFFKECRPNCNEFKSLFIQDLFNVPRQQRLGMIKEYAINALIPISGFAFNIMSKYRVYEKIEKLLSLNSNNDMLYSSFLSYIGGCIFAFLFLKYFTSYNPRFDQLFQPLVISIGSLLPIYFLLENNLNDILSSQVRWIKMEFPCIKNQEMNCSRIDAMITDQGVALAKRTELSIANFCVLALYSLGGFLLMDLAGFFITNWQHLPSTLSRACTRVKNMFSFFNNRNSAEQSESLLELKYMENNYKTFTI